MDAPRVPPAEIEALQQTARELHGRGQYAASAAVYRELLERHGEHLPALLYLAGYAMAQGRADEAQALFERAQAADPSNVEAQRGLAQCLHAQGETERALAGYAHVLAQAPDDVAALLYCGHILETHGHAAAADAAYSLSLDADPRLLSIARDDASSERALLARSAVGAHSRRVAAVMDAALDEAGKTHGNAALRRVREMVDTRVGRRRPTYSHSQQRPFEFYLPGLPDRPWLEPAEFDWADKAREAHSALCRELFQRELSRETLAPYIAAGEPGQTWQELRGNTDWGSLHLYREGVRQEAVAQAYPAAMSLMEALPLVEVPGHAPEVFFSVLAPETTIPPHYGQANYKLTVHLPLVVPASGCGIRVAGEVRHWSEGEPLIFDDSFLHEAWNHSRERRIVLIFDVWNPAVTADERQAIALLFRRLSEWREQRRAVLERALAG